MATTESVSVIKIDTSQAEKSTQNVKQRLKDVREEMQKLAAAGDRTSERYRELATEAGNLAKAQREVAKDVSEASTTFSNTVQYTAGSLSGISGAVQTVTGALGMMGIEMKNDSGFMKLLVSAMSVTSGLQAIQGSVDSFKLLATNIKRATGEQKLLNAALKASPYGLAAAALAGVVAILVSFTKKANEAKEAEKKLAHEQHEIVASAKSEIGVMNSLIDIANDTTQSYEKRKGAVEELNSKYPLLNASLKDEKSQLDINKKAYEDYCKAIINTSYAKAAESKIDELNVQKLDLEDQKVELQKHIAYLEAHLNDPIITGGGEAGNEAQAMAARNSELSRYKKELSGVDSQLKSVNSKLADYSKKVAENRIQENKNKNKNNNSSKTAKDEYTDFEKRQNAIDLLYQQHLDKRLKLEQELQLEVDRLHTMKKGTEEYDQELVKIATIKNELNELPMDRLEIPDPFASWNLDPEIQQIEHMTMSVDDLNAALQDMGKPSLYDSIVFGVSQMTEVYDKYGSAVSTIVGNVTGLLSTLASNEDLTFEEQKKIKIASAIISTIEGAVEAYMASIKAYGMPTGMILGGINAGLVTATGIAEINQIRNTTSDSSSISSNVSTASASTLSTGYSNVRMTDSTGGYYDLGGDISKNLQQVKVVVSSREITEAQNSTKKVQVANRF